MFPFQPVTDFHRSTGKLIFTLLFVKINWNISKGALPEPQCEHKSWKNRPITSCETSELFIISGHFFLENIAKNRPEVYVTIASKT